MIKIIIIFDINNLDNNVYINDSTKLEYHIINYKNIMHLDFAFNNLITFPNIIHKFTNLQILQFNDNNFSDIPSNLPNSIKILYCDNNHLTKLPYKLPKQLTNLYCNYNQIKKLPNNLNNTLIAFNCNNNLLTKLPDLHKLINLRELECRYNFINNIPKCILKFKNLYRYKKFNLYVYINVLSRILNNKINYYYYIQILNYYKSILLKKNKNYI